MELCSGGRDEHEEICYNSRYCPLCELRKDLKDEIERLRKEIVELEENY